MRAGAMWGVLGLAVLGAGCIAGLRMQPPRDLLGVSELLEVAGRSGQFGRGLFSSEDFDLGPYRISDVERDWSDVRGSARDLWFFEGRRLETTSEGGFSFAFGTASGPLTAVCGTATLSRRYDFGSMSVGDETQSLACRCRRGGRVVSSLFLVDAKAGTQWEGWLDLPEARYRVEGQRRLEGDRTSPVAAGYRFDGPRPPPLGAVDVTEPGRVWLHEAFPEGDRTAAACAAAALLLQPRPSQPQTDELPDEYRDTD